MGMLIHVTHGESNKLTDRKTPGCIWCLHACAVWPNGFALRSHVNGIVGTCADRQNSSQIPRIYVSLFPHGPTAHAQTMKKKPQTLASPEVHEKITLY